MCKRITNKNQYKCANIGLEPISTTIILPHTLVINLIQTAMKRKLNTVLISIVIMFTLSSCMATRTNVGQYREMEKINDTYTYSRGKQCYLFWGTIPLGRTKVATPQSANCQVRTYYNFFDALLSVITGGIFAMQTIKVKAIKDEGSYKAKLKHP